MSVRKKLKPSTLFDHTSAVAVLPPPGTADEHWVAAFWEITKPPVGLPCESTPPETITRFEKSVYALHRSIFADVVRRKWAPDFKWQGISYQIRKQTQVHGDLVFRLLELCEAVFQHQPSLGYKHPAEWFTRLIVEGEAWGIHMQFFDNEEELWGIVVEDQENGVVSKTRMKTILQGQNRKLVNLDYVGNPGEEQNPFSQPETKRFFDVARKIAGQDDAFRKQYYKPYVKARQAVAQYFIKHGQVSVAGKHGDIMRTSRQGRRKKST